MALADILTQIDRQIAQLQQARTLLAGGRAPARKAASAPKPPQKKKRRLTPEGRKRIAEAVRRRWAEQRKASGAK